MATSVLLEVNQPKELLWSILQNWIICINIYMKTSNMQHYIHLFVFIQIILEQKKFTPSYSRDF